MYNSSDVTGVLLCGGKGSRLFPITSSVNKHLLPVYSKPMVYYALSVLMLLGVRRICLVCNSRDMPAFEDLLAFCNDLGVTLIFIEQGFADGVVGALQRAIPAVDTKKIIMVLGDNIFFGANFASWCVNELKSDPVCHIFTQKVSEPDRFGVLERSNDGAIIDLVEKPKIFISSEAITGLYCFDLDFLRSALPTIEFSDRGELEVSDLLKLALNNGQLSVSQIPRGTFWIDAGTVKDLYAASDYIKSYETRLGCCVLSPEEVAFTKNWINSKELASIVSTYPHSHYADYLSNLI